MRKGLFDLFKPKSNRERLEKLYLSKGYARIPILPDEEECSKILGAASSFPASLVQKINMSPISTGSEFLPGHIIMLWWFSNPRTDKSNIPQYFLYEYGIDFKSEMLFLQKQHLLNDKRLTNLGEQLLECNSEIVRKHKARKSYNSDGTVTYFYEDANSVVEKDKFITTGDFVEDQFLGRAFERAGDFVNAELAYLSAIQLSLVRKESVPPNPFMRLAIIYRKQKLLDKEEDILLQAISHCDSAVQSKFQDRLDKLKLKKNINTV